MRQFNPHLPPPVQEPAQSAANQCLSFASSRPANQVTTSARSNAAGASTWKNFLVPYLHDEVA